MLEMYIYCKPLLFLNADDDAVACILHNTALLMSGSAVMGVQCKQERSEHTALGSSGVEEVIFVDNLF